ncbi:hypothetical protein STEG23_036896 [Scotinomys teguina]
MAIESFASECERCLHSAFTLQLPPWLFDLVIPNNEPCSSNSWVISYNIGSQPVGAGRHHKQLPGTSSVAPVFSERERTQHSEMKAESSPWYTNPHCPREEKNGESESKYIGDQKNVMGNLPPSPDLWRIRHQ